MLSDLEEIGDLIINEERNIEIQDRISILGNKEAISGRARSLIIREKNSREKKELEKLE